MPRNKLNAYMHFVWATYDRLPLVTVEIERDVHRYIEQVCHDDKCDVLAIGGMPDHVHLLVSMWCMVSFSDLMKHVKGGSSRFVSQKLKPGEWFAWQGSYAVFSVSPNDRQHLIDYIQNQKRHHSDGTTWSDWEKTFEDDAPNRNS